MTVKVLLDTDIGSDIDDAVCLAYFLAQPECELLGITTVSGGPVERAKMASAQCRAAGKDIPIFPGSEAPLSGKQHQPEVPQAAALSRWPHATDFPQDAAIEFMRHTIHAHPGEIVLLPIGPLTNIARLFQADPAIPGLLKALVLMCGRFTQDRPGLPDAEWNALCDAEATAIVYGANAPIHRSVGLDVTTQVTMKASEVRERFATPLLQPVLDFAEVWFEKRPVLTFHDPLAATVLFDDQICMFSRGNVTVDTGDAGVAGRTNWQPDVAGRHEVATGVDAQRFFDHFFGVFR